MLANILILLYIIIILNFLWFSSCLLSVYHTYVLLAPFNLLSLALNIWLAQVFFVFFG